MRTLAVMAQLPPTANLVVPDGTPVRFISRHRDTPIGRRKALLAVLYTRREYRESYGDAAACRAWIEDADGHCITPKVLATAQAEDPERAYQYANV